jgi:hypothetical protein
VEPELDIRSHVVHVHYRILVIGEDSTVRESTEVHSMRFLFPQEIRYFLETAGFQDVTISPFLELDGDPGLEHWNMTVVAR